MPRNRRNRFRDGGASTPVAPAAGTIVVSRSAVAVRTLVGSTQPSVEYFTISEGAGGSLEGPTMSVSYGSGSGWLTLTPTRTATGILVACSVLPGAASAGDYTATVTVADGNDASSEDVTVTMTVDAPAPILRLAWTGGDGYSGTSGSGTSTPANRTVTISNAGPAGSALSGPQVESVDASWLTASISGSGPTWTLTLAPNAGIANLATGSHWATVTVSDPAAPNTVSGTVQLNIDSVTANVVLNVSVNGFSFTATSGGANPATQNATISNIGASGSLAGPTATVAFQNANDPTWCSAAVTGSGPTYTLTLTVTTGALAGGTYNASVTVSDANAQQSVTVPIAFQVSAVPVANPILNVSPSPAPFSYTLGGAVPNAQTATITNVGTGTLAGPTVSSNVTWCSGTVTPTGANTYALTVGLVSGQLGGLTAGTHTGTLTVADANAAQSVAIGVSVVVTAAPQGAYPAPRFAPPTGVTWNPTTGYFEGIPTGITRTPPSNYNAAAHFTPANAAELTSALAASATIANCVIELTAGATYTGRFVPPVRTASGYLVIRSSAYASLPAQGTRVTSTDNANLAVLRTSNALPTLELRSAQERLYCLGVRFEGTGSLCYQLVEMFHTTSSDVNSTPKDIYFDRCRFMGNTTKGTQRGIFGVAQRMACFDCDFWDFKEVNTECQAVLLAHGAGPYMFDNCAFRAAGESFFIGGTNLPAQLTGWIPRDVYLKRCLITTQIEWNQNDVGNYGGTDFTIKNLFETKRGGRVLLDGCVFDGMWADAQSGNAVVLKSVTGSMTTSNAVNETHDVMFHLCLFKRVAKVFGIAGNSGAKQGEIPTHKVHCFDCLGYDLNKSPNKGSGYINEVSNLSKDIYIEHCTQSSNGGTTPSGAVLVGLATNVNITDNLFMQGNYGMFGSGYGEGMPAFTQYWTGYTVTRNVLYAGGSGTNYPSGNYFPATETAVGFVKGSGTGTTNADFALASSSAYYGVLDPNGVRIGCDITRVTARTNGVG